MTELTTKGLLEQAAKLNKLSEVSQVALGMTLVKIKELEAYRPAYDSFDAYYREELSRSKGDISRLLTVGRYMLESGFPQETEVPYTKMYCAIKAFPDKEPEYVLSAAQTNTLLELSDGGRDRFGEHDHFFLPETYRRCETCGKFERS